MTRTGTTRHGSLQFYPRVRAKEFLPSVHWRSILRKEIGLLGFIGYKVGMMSAYVKDNSAHSMTKGKRIVVPVTILECPKVKVLSVRFYRDKKILGEVMNKNLDKELSHVIKLPKNVGASLSKDEGHKKFDDFKDGEFDDIHVVIYSEVKKTGVKKAPDIVEVGVSGSLNEKLDFAKNIFSKEISIKDFIKEGVVDMRGVTKGKGLQGTIKRFGLGLKAHKSEKGRRTLGSGGPWHPSRVDYTQPRAGQMGFFTRIVYNNKIVSIGSISEKDINPVCGFNGFGKLKTDYLIVQGSVQGAPRRQLLITMPLRPSKKQTKKNYEFIELR